MYFLYGERTWRGWTVGALDDWVRVWWDWPNGAGALALWRVTVRVQRAPPPRLVLTFTRANGTPRELAHIA